MIPATTAPATPVGLLYGPLGVRELPPQHHERDHLHHVGDAPRPRPRCSGRSRRRRARGSGSTAGMTSTTTSAMKPMTRADEQRDPRRLALAGEREELRVVAGARQRVHVAPVGEHDALQRGEQADQRERGRARAATLFGQERAEAVEQRLVADAGETVSRRTGAPPVFRNRIEQRRRTTSVTTPQTPAAGCPWPGCAPPRRRAAAPRCRGRTRSRTAGRTGCRQHAERQEASCCPASGLMSNSLEKSNAPVANASDREDSRIAIEMIDDDRSRTGSRSMRPAEFSADEHGVEDHPPASMRPSRSKPVRSVDDAVQRTTRRSSTITAVVDHVLDRLGEAGDEPAPRPHRRAGEGVCAAGVRHAPRTSRRSRRSS